MPTPIALDTESSYAKDRDIRSLGVARYIRHPETDHYLVSVYGDGIAYVATPDKFPWDMLAGADLLSHNAAYDQSVIAELRRRGLPIPQPASWHCTSDLAAYRQSPRSLADAARELLGVQLDKSTRDLMKGRRFNEQSHSVQARVAEYCLYDSKAAYFLWQQHSGHWPSHEQASSDHTAMMCQRGIAVDLDKIFSGLGKLERAKWDAEALIPWAGECDPKGKDLPITSPKLIALECRKRGIPEPPCTDAKSEEFGEWLETHEGQADFVRAISLWRQANRLLNVLETMRDRSIDGILHYSLKYFGASHTGRWSGDAGLNMQNLPRKPFNGVDARACLVPRPGKVFIVADFAQIEARIASWLAGDDLTLAMLRQGVDIYEAHARRTMGYTDPRPLKDVDNDMRHFAKARVLALGFGLGAGKFQRIAKIYTGKGITAEQSKLMVADFRRTNPGIVRLWKRLEQVLRSSKDGSFELELPSGRKIEYFEVAEVEGKLSGRVERGDHRKNLYGGLITENLVQATARDLFSLAILRLEAAGLPVVLHVHDEVVVEVDAANASVASSEVARLMTTLPDWADGLPVATSVSVRSEYGK